MGHDTHFLQRLDTRATRRDHVEYMMGLYHDHELVKYVLEHVKLPADATRVAFAAEDAGEPPHVIVSRTSGAFVTCLGPGMSTRPHPVVPRGQVEGLRAKVQRTREGLALAEKRGLDAARAIKKIETAGPGLSREDFVATAALLGPATTVLTETYAGCVTEFEGVLPLLIDKHLDPPFRREWTPELAGHGWGMAHAAMMHLDTVSREWVEQWAELPAHKIGTPWQALTKTFTVPFFARAAWLAGRLGKVFFPLYRGRYASAADPINLMEAGFGLFAMGLRHAGLRADAARALKSGRDGVGPEDAYFDLLRTRFADLGDHLEKGESEDEAIVTAARGLGQHLAHMVAKDLPEGSRHHYATAEEIPDELALPALLETPLNAIEIEQGFALTMGAIVASARLKAEEFYFPATYLHARGAVDLYAVGDRFVTIQRELLTLGEAPVRREGPKVGRNEPCPCGSGKKYKKCHGA